jgi:hypothetical protein
MKNAALVLNSVQNPEIENRVHQILTQTVTQSSKVHFIHDLLHEVLIKSLHGVIKEAIHSILVLWFKVSNKGLKIGNCERTSKEMACAIAHKDYKISERYLDSANLVKTSRCKAGTRPGRDVKFVIFVHQSPCDCSDRRRA